MFVLLHCINYFLYIRFAKKKINITFATVSLFRCENVTVAHVLFSKIQKIDVSTSIVYVYVRNRVHLFDDEMGNMCGIERISMFLF